MKVTVTVLAGPDRRRARRLVARLRPSLVPGDDVVVLGPGMDPRSPRNWRVLERTALVRPSALPRTNEVVVVLDERAAPSGPWLETLVGALEDPTVGACAPRTNVAEGDELLVGVPYRPKEAGVRRAFVTTLASSLGHELIDAHVLSGPCVAVRRELLVGAGGLRALERHHPVAALGAVASSAGLRLVVAAGSYLHHQGGASPRPGPRPPGTRPLVTACLIVKDERDNLGRCLASLAGFCDEVVVYDTGSVDETGEIARAYGALVVEGGWDGDFARARNAALDHCSGEWVLWIDADEALVADGAAQREALEAASADIEALVVTIDNLRGAYASTTFAHPACRLFRRACGWWTGRLHEQVVARSGAPKLEMAVAEGIRLTHWGYLSSDFESRDKARRNLKSAFGDLSASSGLSWSSRLVNLARSYGLCGHHEETVDLARAAIAAGTTRAVERLALRTIISALLGLDRAEEALGAAGELRAISSVPLLADLETGRALVSSRRDEEALEVLSRVHKGIDDDGFEYDAHDVAIPKATALSRLGRHGEAADVLLGTITEHGGMDVHIGTLVQCLDDAGRSLAEIAEAVPEVRAVAFLGQLPQLEAEVADRVLDAWHEVAPSTAVLATAASVAGRLPLCRREAWSARLRLAGFAHACPLVTVSGPPVEALTGAALAAQRYGDPRGRMAVAALSQCLSDDERPGARHELERRAAPLLSFFDAISSFAGARERLGRGEEEPPNDRTARSAVLVVARAVSIRAMALAVTLQSVGYAVTLVQPPARGARRLLGAHGVDVAECDARHRSAEVARQYAARPLAAVIATRHEPLAELRRLLPAAVVVVDLDDADCPAPPEVLVLTMAPRSGAVAVAASAPQLYAPPGPFPLELREGLCVVGDFEAATPGELAHLGDAVLPLLARRLSQAPVAVIGGGAVAGRLPGALRLGALADPIPWLRAARAVLVGCRAGAEHWLAAAQMCGTPAIAVPGADVDQLVPALAALCDRGMDELWARVAPAAAAVAPPILPDPLSRLPSAHAVEAPRASWCSPGARLLETSGSTVAEVRWGYGALPVEWLGPIRDVVDKVRVPTTWARGHAVSSGVPAAKVDVAALHVGTEERRPEGPRRALRTEKHTLLLYVGDCSERSGVDALLESYFIEFPPHDDVCLVVAATQGAERSPLIAEVRKAASSSQHAEVILVDAGTSAGERAALYRACDAFVCPERAQGDPTTLLEAMACGLPVVLSAGGAFEELCGTEEGYPVSAREVEVVPADAGVLASAGRLWQLEPGRAALGAAMRQVVTDPEVRRRKGDAARRRVLERLKRAPVLTDI